MPSIWIYDPAMWVIGLLCEFSTACIQAAGRDEGSADKQALPRTATAQKTREASSAHSPHVRTEHPLEKGGHGEMQRPVQVTGESEGLTLRGYKCKVLQHHIKVQASLSLSKEAPLHLGEVQSDILKGYTILSGLEQIKP